jgi:hypothetical protein
VRGDVGPVWVKRSPRSVKTGEVIKGLGIVKAIEMVEGEYVFHCDDGRTEKIKATQHVHVQMFSLGF